MSAKKISETKKAPGGTNNLLSQIEPRATGELIKRLSCEITESKLRALKSRATAEGISLKSLVNSWIDSYLSDNK